MIETTTNDALMQEYRLKIKRLTYECDDQRKTKRIAIGVAVVITIGWVLCLIPVRYLQNEYNTLSDKSGIMAQTIENYSAQLDRNIELIQQKDIRIKQLENQIPQ